MGKALRQYWKLVAVVGAVSFLAFGLYIFRFHGSSLSGDPSDWADFATFLSGTVGVAVLTATLIALVHTLYQQSVLVRQQEELIGHQEKQIEISDSHQRRIEAYSRAEKFFPALLNSCLDDLEVGLYRKLMNGSMPCSWPQHLDDRLYLRHLFEQRFLSERFEESGNMFFSFLWNSFLQKPYSLAVLIADCVKDADELKSFFRSEVGEYDEVVSCVLIFAYPMLQDEVEKISGILEMPLDYSGTGMIQERWQKAGEKAFWKVVR